MIKESDIEVNYFDLLNKAYVDTSQGITKPPVIINIVDDLGGFYQEKRLLTLGNLSCIIGKPKSKKTFLSTNITSVAISNNDQFNRFNSPRYENKNVVLYFDTEQGEYDSYYCMRRIEKMAGTKENFYGYNLRQFNPLERCSIIEEAFNYYKSKISFVVFDGVADLANGVNDELEAIRVTSLILRLTKQYNCHIANIIHQNKDNSFAMGWLGGMLTKKAEMVISCSKDSKDFRYSTVHCEDSRSVGFNDFLLTINEHGYPETENISRDKITKSYYDTDAEIEIHQVVSNFETSLKSKPSDEGSIF